MTCKEKVMELYPHMDWGKVVVSECPSDYNWLCDPVYCTEHYRDGEFIESVCERCWNREIPETVDTPRLDPNDVTKLDELTTEKENKEMNCKCEVVDMVKQLQFDKDALLEELKDARERLAEVTECYAESLKERDDLKKKLDEKSHLVDIYGARLDTKDVMIKKLNETNEDLANKLAAARTETERVTDAWRACTELRDTMSEKIVELEDRVAEQNKEIEHKQKLLDDVCASYDKLENNIKEMGFEQDKEITVTMDLKITPPSVKYMFKNGAFLKVASCDCAQSPEDICHAIARSMYNKYSALVDAGFSHDDAMSLIPMWTD